MRFPDLLVHVNRLEEQLRLLEFDISQIRKAILRALPEAEAYFKGVADHGDGPTAGHAVANRPAKP